MPRTLSVREDRILEHIPALAIALGLSPDDAGNDHIAFVRTLQEAKATLIYDHTSKTITADSSNSGPITIRI